MKGVNFMKRLFRTTVIFDISNSTILRTLNINFDYVVTRPEKIGENSEKRFFYYTGNAKSTETSVSQGVARMLNFFGNLKGKFKIINIEELSEPVERYYFNTYTEPDGVCSDFFGTLEEARKFAQCVANERGEDVCINTCVGEEIVDFVSPDEPEKEQITAEPVQNVVLMGRTSKAITQICEILSTNPKCQALTEMLMNQAIEKGVSADEWETMKAQLVTSLFFRMCEMMPELKEGLSADLWDELQKEGV